MLSSDFEKEIQQQLGELRFTPDEVVWQNVEAALPQKKRKRYVFFLLLCLALTGGSWFFWDANVDNKKTRTAIDQTVVKTAPLLLADDNKKAGENVAKAAKVDNENDYLKSSSKTNTASNDGSASTAGNNAKKIGKKTQDVTDEKIICTETNNPIVKQTDAGVFAAKDPLTTEKPYSKEADYSANNNKALIAGSPVNSAFEKRVLPVNTAIETQTVLPGTADANDTGVAAANDASVPNVVAFTKPDERVIKAPDNNEIKTAAASTKNKKTASKWIFGLGISAGISNTKGDLFSNRTLYADPVSTAAGGIPLSYTGRSVGTAHSLAYTGGLYAEKSIGTSWKIYTGINYAYFSSTQQVGQKVDSVIYYSINNDLLQNRDFYRNSANISYVNRYHVLQLPVLVKYTLPGLPLFVQAGPSLSYLIQSSALQYNSTRDAYFSNSQVFNKWLLSLHGGIGFNFTKSSRPLFSLGYNFSFSTSSTTKAVFGSQHLVSSQLYINIPLKK